MFEIFDDQFGIEVLKIGSLKMKFEICDFFFFGLLEIRNFQNLRLGKLNLGIEIWKFEIDHLNFEIMNFVNLKL